MMKRGCCEQPAFTGMPSGREYSLSAWSQVRVAVPRGAEKKKPQFRDVVRAAQHQERVSAQLQAPPQGVSPRAPTAAAPYMHP